ncbi:Rha family transcriptional regulator [Campylobacter upsaliensis]|uniref:Rha family transcriptional regulator n=1 Tax=Campylobacter upsaliensis TaxID=28080 RepID=UPI0022EB311C|nr:Rha family transcriptional regulator [Campylobacter upsaliensis]MEB2801126.1 Rha family transcriptional regulator [Campylobacter upsaliensis]MEB2802782.1 Rha family transcriptional regulator [Campylobacter upsaliensis]MEB2825320.1 Rha family transcriptional regulator [Campylobacter upsaliensis]MEB2827015.1 Rha family transcriptional regulator [Campylobacter upsaliensis]
MSMWKINRQETEATNTNLVNINNKKVEFTTKNNQIFCTSLDIARVFEKRHTHILDIIKNYLNDEDMKEFNQPNFRLVNYKDLKGELRPAYEVSRDGFSFIAMGLTGKKANKWKVSFINAFNKMEQVITQEDFSVDITLKDRNQNNQIIYSHHYEVGGKPRDPMVSKNKEFFENNFIAQQDKSAKNFKSKLKEFNTKNNANKTIKNKDLEK